MLRIVAFASRRPIAELSHAEAVSLFIGPDASALSVNSVPGAKRETLASAPRSASAASRPEDVNFRSWTFASIEVLIIDGRPYMCTSTLPDGP